VGIYLVYLLIEAAKSLFIDAYHLVPLILLKMQDQKSLTLLWPTSSWCDMEHAASSLAYKGGQYSICNSQQPFTTQITKDAKPKIIDTLLTLIFMMGQGACHYFFGLQRRPIFHLYQSATIHNSDYQRCMTRNCWRSFNARFHDGAGSMLLFLWLTKATNTPFMTACNHSQIWLPMMQNQKL